MVRKGKLCGFMIAGLLVTPHPVLASALDGTQWTLQGKKDASKTDTLSFDDGKFNSAASQANGFLASSYETETQTDQTTWTSTQTNIKGETMDWQGNRKGDAMAGLYTFTSADGETVSMRWTATKSK